MFRSKPGGAAGAADDGAEVIIGKEVWDFVYFVKSFCSEIYDIFEFLFLFSIVFFSSFSSFVYIYIY